MAIYPTTLNIESFDEKTIKPVSTSSYNSGYSQKVAKYTRKILAFSFTHENLTLAQKTELDTFFTTNQGLSFSFVHPLTNDTHEVNFEMEEINFSYDKIMKTYSTKIAIKEV